MSYEIYNLIYKNTPDAFITLSSASAVWGSATIDVREFDTGTYFVDIGASNASAAASGTTFHSYLYGSLDQKSWFLQTAFPSLSSVGAGGINNKHYSKMITDIGGGWLKLKYSVYGASAQSTTQFRPVLAMKRIR